ncbi:MAG: tetratricopeptide repeat protein [Limisphaerales bacterium]
MTILSDILLLALVVAASWWLSGYDSKLSGDNNRNDFVRRSIRCGVTLLLLVMMLALPMAINSIPFLLAIILSLVITWTGCLAEMFARVFHLLIGTTATNREFDPHESSRNLDQVAELLRNGRRQEAAQLAESLRASGDANVLALEALLERAGLPFENSQKSTPLAEAGRLQRQGKFAEAENILKTLLAENPANVDAALLLIRLYAHDLHQAGKAAEILRLLEKQPHIPAAALDYAARSIHEWRREKAAPEMAVLPESPDDLIAAGYVGTAIEILERTAKEQPQNFEAQLKLAEAYGLHSANPQRAKKIIEKIENNPAFTAEQVQFAKARLAEWKNG